MCPTNSFALANFFRDYAPENDDTLMTVLKTAHNFTLKQRPISFLLTVETATISLKVLGTPSCRQAM